MQASQGQIKKDDTDDQTDPKLPAFQRLTLYRMLLDFGRSINRQINAIPAK
jgi:hypothetical protein